MIKPEFDDLDIFRQQQSELIIKLKEEENKKNEEDINWSKDDKKNEFQKYINENIILKKNLNLLKIEYNEKVKKLNEISKAYDESKNKNNNYIEMLKEREKIIENNEKKIKNLFSYYNYPSINLAKLSFVL